MTTESHTGGYDPDSDLAERWTGWSAFQTADLPEGTDELIDSLGKTILFDVGEDDRVWALAHAIAHLDLDHHLRPDQTYSLQQEMEADELTRIRCGEITIADFEAE